MKAILFLSQYPIVIFLSVYSCRHEYHKPDSIKSPPVVQIQDSVKVIAFEKDVLPILQAKCSPCHFEGGKMYQKMPFDNPKTIADHTAGVLKRFKEPELVTIKAYLDQVKQ